jgi:hypothetical protein
MDAKELPARPSLELVRGMEFPSGYAEVDELLQRFGKDAEP